MLVVSTGCPAGVGPEVSVHAAARVRGVRRVLVGDESTLLAAADLRGVPRSRFVPYSATADPRKLQILHAGPRLRASDRRPGRPSKRAGAAQLAYLEAAHQIVSSERGALVTAPVSKAAIARSGAEGAAGFIGHTEWLAQRDRARRATMCFWSDKLVSSVATTHVPLARVPRALSEGVVADACEGIVELLRRVDGRRTARVAVASLNPHAGENELFGREEARAIVPGIRRARRRVGRAALFVGPIGAETAFRKAAAGEYDGVVAMYHDQATVPMKLAAFGDAVNVTTGLSFIRTSVDHGTAYDIAWTGVADPKGMVSALQLARRML